jgi:hypothetical protein
VPPDPHPNTLATLEKRKLISKPAHAMTALGKNSAKKSHLMTSQASKTLTTTSSYEKKIESSAGKNNTHSNRNTQHSVTYAERVTQQEE